MTDGYLRIKTKIDNSDTEAQLKVLTSKLNDLKASLTIAAGDKTLFSKTEIIQMEAEVEKLTGQISKLNGKNVKGVTDGIDKATNSTEKFLKKLLKIGITIFGIESAFGFVRQMMAALSETNDQIKADIDYFRYAMAQAFLPVIQAIISGVYKILSIINSISIAMFGFNLFGKASAENFKKVDKSAKSISKTLAGFDEMNVLGGQAGGGSSTTGPSMDLSKMTTDLSGVTKLIKSTISFWEKDWKNFIGFVDNQWFLLFDGMLLTLKGFYDIFKGIMEIISGLWTVMTGLLKGDMEKVKQGFKQMADGIVLIFNGMIEVIIGLLISALGAIYGILATLASWIWKNVIKPVGDMFTSLWNGLADGAGTAWNKVKQIFSAGGQVFNGIKEGIENTFKAVVNALITGINVIISAPFKAINGMLNTIRTTSFLGVSPFKGLWNNNPITVPQIPKLATGGIVNRPTFAQIGEAGPERVIPLSEDAEWISKVADAFASKINGSGGAVNIYLDGRLIQKQMQTRQEELSFARNR